MKERIRRITDSQREFFLTQTTKDVEYRIAALKKLKDAIRQNEAAIFSALKHDVGKPSYEAYITEVGFTIKEIDYHIKHLKSWAKPHKIKRDLINFDASSVIQHEPFGVVLIMAPWNYPFQLVMSPLVGALSAGNCAVLKPADYAKKTAEIIRTIIEQTFESNYVAVVTGDREVNQQLFDTRFDYIFFTGSPSLGKYAMEKASQNLTPITLELGGKSPCIVDHDADIDIAARRIAFGKYINAGQTCIAPDYVFAHSSIKDELLKKIQKTITEFYGSDPEKSSDFGRIINDRQYARLKGLMSSGHIFTGGKYNDATRYIEPTVLDNVTPEDPIMQEEIFGPILPVMSFKNLDTVIEHINTSEKPLALYFFSENSKTQKHVLEHTTSGGMCINDTIMHTTNPRLPFGGVGFSGMGPLSRKIQF